MGKRLSKKLFKKRKTENEVEVKTEKEQEVTPVRETKKKKTDMPLPPSLED